jgi:radical SAM-linked protein
MTHSPQRLRIRFSKRGVLRWISHRDLARVWERLLRRAELSLAFSQGFHPKPKISFPSALPLGVEALEEVVELELLGHVSLADVQRRITEQAPEGLEVVSLQFVESKAKFLGGTYQFLMTEEVIDGVQQRIAAITQDGWVRVEREGKLVECRVSDPLFHLSARGIELTFSLPAASEGAAIRPNDLLEQLGLGHLLADGTPVVRVKVHLADDQKSNMPNLRNTTEINEENIQSCEPAEVTAGDENNRGQA